MSSSLLQRKAFSEWRSTNGIAKNQTPTKGKHTSVGAGYMPNFAVPTAQMSVRLFDGHADLTIGSIKGVTRPAELKPFLCDIAFEEEGISVWYWRANDEVNPIEAVFHSDIRKKLIELASSKGDYDLKPDGEPGTDVTAFYTPHKNWRGQRGQHRPEVLLKFRPPENYGSTDKDVGYLYYKKRLIVDYRSYPLKAHNMPLTFSSNVEGWRLEAIRRTDPRISLKDIEARVRTVNDSGPGSFYGHKPVCDENALAARARRFRERDGAISWCAREGSEGIRIFMYSRLTEEEKETNSAHHCDLTDQELAELRQINLGKNPERARKANRSASETDAARNKYVQKTHAMLTNASSRKTRKELSHHDGAGHTYDTSNAHGASNNYGVGDANGASNTYGPGNAYASNNAYGVGGASDLGNAYGAGNDHGSGNAYGISNAYGPSNAHGSSNVYDACYPSNTISGGDSGFDDILTDDPMSGNGPVSNQEVVHNDKVLMTACGEFVTDDLSGGNMDWDNHVPGNFPDNNVLGNQMPPIPEGGQTTAANNLVTSFPLMNDNTFDLNLNVNEDSRYDVPQSYREVMEICAALAPTFVDFFCVTRQKAYPKDCFGSYMQQYQRIQNYFASQYWPQDKGPAPTLSNRGTWSGGIPKWLQSEVFSIKIPEQGRLMRDNPVYFHDLMGKFIQSQFTAENGL